jgi:hypothetical protein
MDVKHLIKKLLLICSCITLG